MGKKGVRERVLGRSDESAGTSPSIVCCEPVRKGGIKKRIGGDACDASVDAGRVCETRSMKKRTQSQCSS